MESPATPSLKSQLGAALDWWREAGVDFCFEDEPKVWLQPEESAGEKARTATAPIAPAKRAIPQEPPPPPIGGDSANWPQDLAQFRQWWLTEPSLDPTGMLSGRVASRGDAGAALTILVPMPEAEDGERLLSGREGALIAGMTAAMGLSEQHICLAACLPRHMVEPDWEELARRGLGEVVRHHLSLIGTTRLLVLGRSILPLLGHASAQRPAAIKETSIQGKALPTLIAFAPARLLSSGRQRASLWRRWLDWTEGDL